jgi:ATP-dependent Clp protease adaptor protein ClpS
MSNDSKKLQEQEGLALEERPKTKKPSLYKVLLLNDDYTPMEFVVQILKLYFQKSEAEAFEIMLKVHNEGAGIAGVFQYDIAEMKVHQVNLHARKHEFPLRCVMEKE